MDVVAARQSLSEAGQSVVASPRTLRLQDVARVLPTRHEARLSNSAAVSETVCRWFDSGVYMAFRESL